MDTWLTEEKKKELRDKTEYYRQHPKEAHRKFLKRDDGVVIITPPKGKENG